MSRGPGAARRLISGILLVGVASAALAAAGPDALMPFKDAAGAATEVSVAFVVDFGGLGAPVVGCVQVPSTDNGYAALGAFVAQHGEAQPIYNNAGLLCSIDNLPGNAPTVCGAQVAGGYDYWSYWHGTTGSWVYASTGAFSAVQEGDLEGWRFETDGQSNPNDPHPLPAPSYASICGSAVSTPTSPAPPAAAPATAVAPSTGLASGGATPKTSDGSGRSSVATTPVPATAHPAAAPSSSTTPSVGVGGTSGTTAPSTRPSHPGLPAQSLRATPAADDRAGGGDGALPAIVGALLVLALAAGAVFGWRRRARPE